MKRLGGRFDSRREQDQVLAAFRDQNLRCTPQRYAILEHLRQRKSHPTAEQIYHAINKVDPRASLATVYKALHALVDGGLIKEVHLVGHAVRYESHMEKHHHFVCDQCGHVEDIEWFDVPQVAQKAALGPRTFRSYELVLRGRCQRCSK